MHKSCMAIIARREMIRILRAWYNYHRMSIYLALILLTTQNLANQVSLVHILSSVMVMARTLALTDKISNECVAQPPS